MYKIAMEETAAGAAWPGDEAPISILQCTFPPFDVTSVHPSVNLPHFLQDFYRCVQILCYMEYTIHTGANEKWHDGDMSYYDVPPHHRSVACIRVEEHSEHSNT